jgi:hypothetical protein
MMNIRCLAFVVVASVSAGAVAQTATYYRWKDANDVTHYGDAPPAGSKAEAVTVNGAHGVASPGPAVPVAATPKSAPQGGPSDALVAADAAARARNCDNAKRNLDVVGANMVVDSTDPSTARRLSGEQLDASRVAAQRDVAANCAAGAK